MKLVCNENTKRSDIIKVLNHIMIDKGLKNKDVLPKLGMTKQTVSNVLSPTYRPDSSMTIDTLVALCQAIGCQLVIDVVPVDVDQNTDK